MNNQNVQAVEGTKIANKLINKLAYSQLEEVKREVEIDELNERINQLTQTNQQLQVENQRLKSQGQDSTATKDEKQPA